MGHSHLKLPIWLMQTPFVQIAGISLHSSISAHRQYLSASREGSREESIPHSWGTAALVHSKKKTSRKGPPDKQWSNFWRIHTGSCRSCQARAALQRSGYTTEPHKTPSRRSHGITGRACTAHVGMDPTQDIHLVFSECGSAVTWTLAQALGSGCKWEVQGVAETLRWLKGP